jgi:hypothetical protein
MGWTQASPLGGKSKAMEPLTLAFSQREREHRVRLLKAEYCNFSGERLQRSKVLLAMPGCS